MALCGMLDLLHAVIGTASHRGLAMLLGLEVLDCELLLGFHVIELVDLAPLSLHDWDGQINKRGISRKSIR